MVSLCVVFVVLATSKDRTMSYAAMLAEGFFGPFVNLVGYVYMCEFLTPFWVDQAASMYCIFYAFVPIILTFYYEFISKYYYGIFAFGFAMLLLGSILGLLAVESPLWLLSVGKIDEGLIGDRKICRVNGMLTRCETLIKELPDNVETEQSGEIIEIEVDNDCEKTSKGSLNKGNIAEDKEEPELNVAELEVLES